MKCWISSEHNVIIYSSMMSTTATFQWIVTSETNISESLNESWTELWANAIQCNVKVFCHDCSDVCWIIINVFFSNTLIENKMCFKSYFIIQKVFENISSNEMCFISYFQKKFGILLNRGNVLFYDRKHENYHLSRQSVRHRNLSKICLLNQGRPRCHVQFPYFDLNHALCCATKIFPL